MIISPSHLIDGLILMMRANTVGINEVIHRYDPEGYLHLFKGIRKTLPLDAFPSLEFEIVSGNMEWHTTSAMQGEYAIDCLLTLRCGTDVEKSMDYMSETARKIISVFNYPVNMSWPIPEEYLDAEKTVPILCQYSDVRSVDYMATKDYAMRVARWQINCKTVEGFPPVVDRFGPARVEWREE